MYKGIVFSSTVKGKIPPYDFNKYAELYNDNIIDFIKIIPVANKKPGH